MKSRSVVIFPDTLPSAEVLIPLVQVFAPIVYCQPVENDEEWLGEAENLWQELREESLCRFDAPAPLGADRERFLHLLSNLRNRRDDYAVRLKYLSLAFLSPRTRSDNESKSSILTSLLRSYGIHDRQEEKRTLLLWQARLMLKLGEFFDAEQRQLGQEFRKISERQHGLLTELRNETEAPFSPAGDLSSAAGDPDGQQLLRLKAWSRMFALGPSVPEASGVFVTGSRDAVERLAEEYGRRKGAPPEALIELSLPAAYAGDDGPVSRRNRFRREGADLLEKLDRVLAEPSRVSDQQRRAFIGRDNPWDTLLERYYPLETCGRCHMTLYDFPGIAARRLFLDSFGRDEDDELQEEVIVETGSSLVVGLLAS